MLFEGTVSVELLLTYSKFTINNNFSKTACLNENQDKSIIVIILICVDIYIKKIYIYI